MAVPRMVRESGAARPESRRLTAPPQDGPWLTALLHASSQGFFFRNCTAHPGGVVNLFNLESCSEQCPGCFGAAARGGSAAPVESLLQVRPHSLLPCDTR